MVRVSVEPARVEVGLGAAVSVEVRVFNASEIVDHFAVSALGVDPAWVSVDVETAQLEPGAEAMLTLSIALPETAHLVAGEHVVGIRVASLSNPAESAVEEIRLDVGVQSDLAFAMEPSQLRATRSARANLRIDNAGNRPVGLEFSGTDPEMVMGFTFAPPQLEVPAFAESDVVVGIRLPRRWMGRPVTRPFSVSGRHPDGSTSVSGTVVQRALVPPWLVKVATGAVGVALIAVLALVATGNFGGVTTAEDDDSAATQTTAAPTPTTEDETQQGDTTTSTTATTSTVPSLISVADLVGLTAIEAQAWADGQGIELSVSNDFVDVAVDSGLAGRIAEQSMAVGTQVEPGTSMSVAIGVVRVVQVPDVTGQSEAVALQTLSDFGLVGSVDGTVTVSPLSRLRGAIAEQNPAAGSDLEQGATVSLLVGQIELIIIPDPRLLARYPLTGDGVDATGRSGDATLTNITFAEGGAYCHGVHSNIDASGCEILTPALGGLDFNRFSVHLEFRPTMLQDGPVVVGGTSHRWIGFLLNADGTTTLLYNNSGRQQCDANIQYSSNQWNGAALTYDGTTGRLYLDGQLACEVAFELDHANDANFGTGNYSTGKVFEGWVRGLLVYDDVVAGGAG
ncbi:MAG: PASTA domain-containing protein [bacterium]|nr:PASTA domain-containing protein [bacterium]